MNSKSLSANKSNLSLVPGLLMASVLALLTSGCDQPLAALNSPADTTGSKPAVSAGEEQKVADEPSSPSDSTEDDFSRWGATMEYGEFMATAEELTSVPVNEIVKSMRLNAQAMHLGNQVYEKSCAQCHGPDLKGLPDMHTPDLTDSTWRFSGDDLESVGKTKLPSDVEWTVRYGIRSDHPKHRGGEYGMLAYVPEYRNPKELEDYGTTVYLSETEIDEMVEYVLALSGQPHDVAMASRAADYFQDNAKGNCTDCHGRDGAGIATFGSTNLTDKSMYLYGSDRAAIRESIRKGRQSIMPAFENTLTPAEIKAVSTYVFWHASH